MRVPPAEATAVMIIRVWREAGMFRSTVRFNDDVARGDAPPAVMATSPEQVVNAVREWLAAIR